jgi:hypothetical protein
MKLDIGILHQKLSESELYSYRSNITAPWDVRNSDLALIWLQSKEVLMSKFLPHKMESDSLDGY